VCLAGTEPHRPSAGVTANDGRAVPLSLNSYAMMHRVPGTDGCPGSLAATAICEVDPGAYVLQRGYLG
jgi:hypothetical protein